jgi:phenylalanyl-tRNA synthetase beta chain
MKASLSWLKTYVDIEMGVDQLAHKLTMAGLEVDSVYDRYGNLSTVLVGRIISVKPHPRADKLKLCAVEAGSDTRTVVCGAPNAVEGMLAPLALPGTVLVDGTPLTESTIRGERSQGMLCSEIELGLGTDGSGLMVLDTALVHGTPLNQALDLSDPVLDIDLTPNRPDCLSILGIAREVAAFQGCSLKRPDTELPDEIGAINDHTSVIVEAPDHCPRYSARLVIDLQVAPSPFWLQDRLLSVGLRPINNLVDITNFVMMETGQPLHAFDFDNLAEHRIVVRTAHDNEPFTTLDGKARHMAQDMLMICDGEKPVGIAGVMGGMNSEIEPGTSRVLLESACFDPVSIRKTAKRLGLNTDAAHRFERGVDPGGTLYALDRAAGLMARLGRGTLIGGTIDEQFNLPQPAVIDLSVEQSNRALGINLSAGEMAKLLGAIEFNCSERGEAILHVEAPSFRVDVSRPQDLMEEIARLWGYDNIPTTFTAIPAATRPPSKLLIQRQRIRDIFCSMGFSEAINYSFIHKDSCDRLRLNEADGRRNTVSILNPLTEDQAILRTSLIPGLLESMQRNSYRQSRSLKLFETGKIFISNGIDTQPDENEILAGLWTGQRGTPGWYAKPEMCDFYDLKGALENLFASLRIADLQFTRLPGSACTTTKPGATAQVLAGTQVLGTIGEVHPLVLKAYDLKQTAFVFELEMDKLVDLINEAINAQPLPKYPSTSRDATLIVDRTVESDTLLAQIRQMDQELVEEIQLFDIFQGDPVPQGRKSVSFRIIYRSAEETLEDETVNQLHKTITDRLVSYFKADLPA